MFLYKNKNAISESICLDEYNCSGAENGETIANYKIYTKDELSTKNSLKNLLIKHFLTLQKAKFKVSKIWFSVLRRTLMKKNPKLQVCSHNTVLIDHKPNSCKIHTLQHRIQSNE